MPRRRPRCSSFPPPRGPLLCAGSLAVTPQESKAGKRCVRLRHNLSASLGRGAIVEWRAVGSAVARMSAAISGVTCSRMSLRSCGLQGRALRALPILRSCRYSRGNKRRGGLHLTHNWPKARKLDVLETMLVIRRFEESLVHLFAHKHFMAHFHLYIGQEATGVAIMQALKAGDRLVTTHRNHGHVLGRGADPAPALAGRLTRTTGLCNGYGGTLHLTEPDLGFLHTSSIVGGCIGLATGAAFALKKEGGDAIAVAFFGDGSLEEGISFEAMNFAALWKLPILYVCENNSRGALGSVKGGFPTSVSAVTDIASI